MTVLRRILERLGLTLNEAKTTIVNAYKGSFDFLGFSDRLGGVPELATTQKK